MKKNKTIKYLIGAVVVLILFSFIGKKMGWIGKGDVLEVNVEKVMLRNIIETVSANGKVQPEVEVKMSADVSGEVVEMNVKEGDAVKKGDLLAKINPDIYLSNVNRMSASLNTTKANLANAKARLSQAESQFVKAELTFNRNKKLYDDGTISASDFEAIKSAYEVAKADVDAAKQNVVASEFGVKSSEASVKESEDNLLKTSIFAPVNGTISKLNVEKGERVVGTSQMTGTEIMRLANLNEMEVNVDVNENDIVRVHLGDTALIEVDAYLNRKFKGVVTEIANTANTMGQGVDQVTNFTVKIRIVRESYLDLIPKENPNQSPFRPGMSATVDIQTKKASNILSVPIQSVTTRDTAKSKYEMKYDKQKATANKKESEPQECIFLFVNGKAKLQVVKTGVQDNNYIEIISGIQENQEVITGPYSAVSKTLKDDKDVKATHKDKSSDKGTEISISF